MMITVRLVAFPMSSFKSCTIVADPQEIESSHSTPQIDQGFQHQEINTKKTQVVVGKKIICNKCGKQFKSRQAKSYHLRNVHGVDAKGNVVLQLAKDKVDGGEKIMCYTCDKLFKSIRTKTKHQKLVHGVDAKGNVVLQPARDKVSCVFCDKKYSNAFTLQRHLETIHIYNDNKLELYKCSKCQYKTPHKHNLLEHIVIHKTDASDSVSDKQKCLQCDAQFTCKRNLKRHTKKAHGINKNKSKVCRKCPMCSFKSSLFLKTEIYKHFEEVHNINMKWEHHEFKSLNDFQIWKEVIEKTAVATYVKSRTWSKNHCTYKCNRCGIYKHKGRGLRNTKINGSCKINSFCPSEMKLKQIEDKFEVKYLANHVGHKMQVEHTRLSFQDRKCIAQLHNNSIKNIMCKHIYTVGRTTLPVLNRDVGMNTKSDVGEIQIDTVFKKNTKSEVVPFEVKKIALIEEFKGMLTALEPNLHSKEQLEFLKKHMLQLKNVVESMCSTKGKGMKEVSLPGPSKNIVQQRRLISSKKKVVKTETSRKSENIISDLLFTGSSNNS